VSIKFLQLLFAPDGVGQASLNKLGLAPISPPIVSQDDWAQVPGDLQSVVKTGDPLGN